MEALETDDELIAKLKKQKTAAADKDVIKVFTETELSRYDGSPGSPGLYIALLGVVYDVEKGTVTMIRLKCNNFSIRISVLWTRRRIQFLCWQRREQSLCNWQV